MTKVCAIPFINLSPRPDGVVKACSDGIHHTLPLNYNLNEDNVEGFWNGSVMRQLRMDMIEGKTIPHCNWCDSVEARGGKSKRVHINKKYLEKYKNRIVEAKENDGRLSKGPSTWEFRFSSVCNSACLTCAPTNSTLIEKQFRQNIDVIPAYDKLVLQGIKGSNSRSVNSLFMSEFWKYLDGIDRIELHGGEPFYDPETIEVLKKIVETGRSKEIELLVHCNMTSLTVDTIKMLNKFKRIYFRGSVDGYGRENDHIRWPCKWKDVIKGLKLVDDHLDAEHYKIISGTMSVYNCLSLDQVYSWIMTDFPDWGLDWAPAFLPKRFYISMIDIKKREVTARKIEALIKDMKKESQLWWPGVKAVLLTERESTPEEIVGFVEYANAMDKIRKQDTLKLFPHLQEIYDKYEKIENRDEVKFGLPKF